MINKGDWFCALCNKVRLENMIQCLEYKIWVREVCGRVLKNDTVYYCPKCIS